MNMHVLRARWPPCLNKAIAVLQEDDRLAQLVQLHGPKKWSLIATHLETKGSKQVTAEKFQRGPYALQQYE